MLAFRNVASREMAKREVRTFAKLPGFDLWFQDWTLPRAVFGRRVELREQAGRDPEHPDEETNQAKTGRRPDGTSRRRRRGRPKGSTNPEVIARKEQLLEAWD